MHGRRLLRSAFGLTRRCFFNHFDGNIPPPTPTELRKIYDNIKASSLAEEAPLTNPRAVFANNEIDLSQIGVYGFDYDYTLAVYTRDLNRLIYKLAIERLVRDLRYPAGIRDIDYTHRFAVRGLHFDQSKGLLFKLDGYAKIQPGTVYRGHTCLSDDEVNLIYPRHRVSYQQLEKTGNKDAVLRQLADLFSLPEIGLISCVVEYFDRKEIKTDALALSQDVKAAVALVHTSGQLYEAITGNMERYIHRNDGIREFLTRLREADKTTFVITNSPFDFMDTGMNYLVGNDWRSLFDYIVVSAKKPRFFNDSLIPFRHYIPEKKRISWHRVGDIEKGVIYSGGNLADFVHLTGIYPKGVLYFGDHIDSDLKAVCVFSDPMLKLGWRTGAIVPELGGEVATQNTPEYRRLLSWLSNITVLIESQQDRCTDEASRAVLQDWLDERDAVRVETKSMFNKQFGSAFRTFHSNSYFSERLMRLADVYTSRLPNLLQYSLDHTFYPRRFPLPHEPSLPQPKIPGTGWSPGGSHKSRMDPDSNGNNDYPPNT